MIEFSSVLSKKDVNADDIEFYFNNFIENFTIIELAQKDLQIFIKLLKKYNLKGNRVYDAVIVATALSNGISKIATFDEGFMGFAVRYCTR